MNNRKNQEKFYFDRGKKIILYGAATIGNLLYEHLTKKGYCVTGFIDLRAEEIKTLRELPVFLMEDKALSRDCIIIIAVKNVWEHERIANNLIKNGYHQLIYRPYNCLNGAGSKKEKELNAIYDNITNLKNSIGIFEGYVPRSNTSLHIEFKATNVLKETDGILTVYIPITLIYTDKKEGIPEFPIAFLKPHIKFAKYILGLEGGDLTEYMQYCLESASKVGGFETTDAWKKNVIRNRSEIYSKMNYMYNLEKDYFVRQAPFVQWNDEKKYFNLCSGKHRITFLIAKGDNYIAVKMSKDDYTIWVKEPLVNKVRETMMEQVYYGKAVPIENPFFYESSSMVEQFWYHLIRKIMERISEEYYNFFYTNELEGKSFLVDMPELGFVKRFLIRCGFNVYSNNECSKLETELNELFGLARLPQRNFDVEKEFDYVLTDKSVILSEDDKLNAKHIFVISEKEYKKADKIMTGIYNDKRVSVYLLKHKEG